jgi:hypothetical protein
MNRGTPRPSPRPLGLAGLDQFLTEDELDLLARHPWTVEADRPGADPAARPDKHRSNPAAAQDGSRQLGHVI